MAGGEAPRRVPRAPCHPLPSRALTPRSPQDYYSELGNKLRAGITVLPENVFRVVAGALNYASWSRARDVVIRIEAAEKEHLGDYGLWSVRLEDGGSRPEHIQAGAHDQRIFRETVRTWHGPVECELVVSRKGSNEYEFTTKVRLSSGPNELWRALWIASRALFLRALDEVGECPG